MSLDLSVHKTFPPKLFVMKSNKSFLALVLALSLQSTAQVPIKKEVIKGNQVQPISNRSTAEMKTAHNKVYDFSNVRICVDKVSSYDPGPRPMKQYPSYPRINNKGELEPGTTHQALSVYTNKMWPTDQVITVAFYPNEASNI